jgi:hypothetical protein
MPTIGKRGLSCLKGVSVSKLEVIFCAPLPLKGVLKRAAEDNFVNLLIRFIGVGEGLFRLLPLTAGFVFFFMGIDISEFP